MTIVCYECAADMIETSPDSFRCPCCGFKADQTSIPLETEGRQLQVPSKSGWMTREEVRATGKPVFEPGADKQSGRWHNGQPPTGGFLISRKICEQNFCPVDAGEAPAAYVYSSDAPAPHRYLPLYFRSKDQIK